MLLAALHQLGVFADFLANGALIVTVPDTGSATDHAAQAARAALCIRHGWPAAIVSLATGRGSLQGRNAVGEVVTQAARVLRRGSDLAFALLTSGVFADSLSARLLHGRFAQTPQPDGTLLLSEEKQVDASRLLLGKPTPCVGRETELGTLDAQLSGCIEESDARAVLIVAPPGARHRTSRAARPRTGQRSAL